MRRSELSFLLVLLLAACGKQAVHGVTTDLAAEPSSVEFGPLLVGTEATRTFALLNRSQLSAPFSLSVPAPYHVAPSSGTLQPGGHTTITVTFDPVFGDESDVTIAATGDTLKVPVTGRGVEAAFHASLLNFGQVTVGQSSTLPLVIHSDSELPLSLTFDLTQGTQGIFSLGALPDDVDGNGTASVDVTFTPPHGPQSAAVSITPCSTCDAVQVQLLGVGVFPGTISIPRPLEFGTVTVGRSVSRIAELKNVGDLPAVVTSANLVSGRQFSIQGGVSGTVRPGDSLFVTVVFTPLATGDDTGSLAVVGENDVQLGLVPLHGMGGGPDLVADPTSLDLGLRAAGIPEERTIAVKNAGMGAVRVMAMQVTGAGAAAWKVVPSSTLPADVSTNPLSLDVTFLASVAGDYPAQIVLRSDQDDQPELDVPLNASAVVLPPCQATLTPASIRFGIVPQGKEKTRKVRLTNTGADDCLVMDVSVDPATSHFLADRALAGQLVHAGESQDIPVTFTASAVTGLPDLADLHVRISDPIMPERVANLSALPTQLDVEAQAVDFGSLPVGYRGVKPLTVTNVGKTTAQVSKVTMVAGTSNEFNVLASTNDLKLPPGGIYTAQLGYAPSAPGPDAGEAAVNFALYSEPLFVDLTGEGSTEPCGDLCLTPVASCPLEQTVTVDDTVTLAGGATEPGHVVTCTWKVTSAPPESTARPELPRQCNTVFQPDAPGDYDLQLTVQDDRGQTSSCDTKVHAVIGPGLWVELYWALPGDVDLHLFHPDGGDSHDPEAWNVQPYDCFFGNMGPDWDVTGLADDDPYLDHDDTFGTGPENIHLSYPVPGISYALGLRWFAQAQALTQTTATTRIYCGGQLVDNSDTTLNELHELVVFGTVEFAADGTCKVVKDGTVLHY